MFSDEQIYYLGCELVMLLAGALALYFFVRRLSASRAGLAIALPIAVAFGLRLAAAVGLELTSVASELRGGDEFTFLIRAQEVVDDGLLSQTGTDALTSQLQVFCFAIFKSIIQPTPEFMLRVFVITVAVAGIVCLAAGVWELAGPRAATLAAWVVAVEPAHVFFSGILHKEPFMFLAEGLLVLGGARLWRSGHLGGIVPLVLGCLVAISTRPYVGWFFIAAAAAVVLHASLRHRRAERSIVLVAVAVLLVGIFVPFAYDNSSNEKLAELQASQDANASDTTANLSFEEIDYSTREDMILNLPERMRDVISKPYPWQLENTSQRLGLLGTLIMLGGLVLLFSDVLRRGRTVMQRAGPVIYPAIFALIAYSLSAGNAGTAYRYRTHVVALVLCAVVAVRAQRRSEREAEPSESGREPSAAPTRALPRRGPRPAAIEPPPHVP